MTALTETLKSKAVISKASKSTKPRLIDTLSVYCFTAQEKNSPAEFIQQEVYSTNAIVTSSFSTIFG